MIPEKLSGANYGGDSGDFLAAMLTGGIPHPTGYPSYILFGWLIQNLPLSTPYFRGALLSVIPAAFAAGMLSLWVSKWLVSKDERNVWSGVIAGILFGTAPLFWSQAVIVEVHGLQMLFVVLGLWWVSAHLFPDWSKSHVVLVTLLAFVLGFGVGNHVTIIFLLPTFLFAALVGYRRGASRKFLIVQGIAYLTGLLIYLYLPLRARAYPPINWGNPQTWKGFWWLITAQPYHHFAFSAPLPDILGRFAAWAALLREQFGVVGLILGVIGVVQFHWQEKHLRSLLFWILGIYSVFAIGYYTSDSVVYLLPAHLVFAVWIALAIAWFWDEKLRGIPWGRILGMGILIGFLIRIAYVYPIVDPRRDTSPATFAETYLSEAPPKAVLITASDVDTFPLWYYHFGFGWRSDVIIVVGPLTRFSWYQESLIHTYPEVMFPLVQSEFEKEGDWWMRLLALNPDRPVCYSQPSPEEDVPVGYFCQEP
ncbi:MAG: DUF2723 domain-containing protein [Chloroflexota bacterium]